MAGVGRRYAGEGMTHLFFLFIFSAPDTCMPPVPGASSCKTLNHDTWRSREQAKPITWGPRA
jgi:hypothetical protein